MKTLLSALLFLSIFSTCWAQKDIVITAVPDASRQTYKIYCANHSNSTYTVELFLNVKNYKVLTPLTHSDVVL